LSWNTSLHNSGSGLNESGSSQSRARPNVTGLRFGTRNRRMRG
jgi:hypothetical protein